jgi:hypothetical protein
MSDFDVRADAVEEIVRWATPVIHFRAGTQDTEIDGHPIKEGEKVVMFFNSANRDGCVREPVRLRLHPITEPARATAVGARTSAQAPISPAAICVMFEEIFKRLPDPPDHRRAGSPPVELIHGFKRKPCAYTPSRRSPRATARPRPTCASCGS